MLPVPGATTPLVNRLPSPLGRGCPATAFCPAVGGRVRGYFSRHAKRCYTLPVRIPTQRIRELRRNQTEAEKAA